MDWILCNGLVEGKIGRTPDTRPIFSRFPLTTLLRKFYDWLHRFVWKNAWPHGGHVFDSDLKPQAMGGSWYVYRFSVWKEQRTQKKQCRQEVVGHQLWEIYVHLTFHTSALSESSQEESWVLGICGKCHNGYSPENWRQTPETMSLLQHVLETLLISYNFLVLCLPGAVAKNDG